MTAELIAACRAAIAASDETAKAAAPGPWSWDAIGNGENEREWTWQVFSQGWDLAVMHDGPSRPPLRPNPTVRRANCVHIAANDPVARLALNAALTVVLDGIEATLREHFQTSRDACFSCSTGQWSASAWPCGTWRRVTASLTAIARALGVQEPS